MQRACMHQEKGFPLRDPVQTPSCFRKSSVLRSYWNIGIGLGPTPHHNAQPKPISLSELIAQRCLAHAGTKCTRCTRRIAVFFPWIGPSKCGSHQRRHFASLLVRGCTCCFGARVEGAITYGGILFPSKTNTQYRPITYDADTTL